MLDSYDIFDRPRLTLHCLITLKSPLSHIGEVTGNVSNLKTLKILDLEGNPRSCFVYSGNALRNGILRRRGVASALTELGLTVNPDVHHTMFAGGRIDGSTASNMELDTQIRQLMPWLSVLGTAKPVGVFGSKDAQMVQGRLNVGSAYLVCYESAAYIFSEFPGVLPPDALAGLKAFQSARSALHDDPFIAPSDAAISAYNQAKSEHLPYLRKVLRSWTEYLAIDQTTRRDSTADPNLKAFIAQQPGQMSLLNGDTKKPEKEKKTDQMIASDRLIMSGSTLYSRWDLHTTEVETGWIVDTLLRFAENPYLGGKGNRGNGLCSMEFWYQAGNERGHFLSLATGQQSLSDRATEAHQAYRSYVDAYQQFLSEAKSSQELRGMLGATLQ